MRRIVLDQGLPFGAVTLLRADGWDAVHVRELGMKTAADTEILTFAGGDRRTIITLDRDFPQILALTSANHPSVVLIRQQGLRAAGLVELLTRIWLQHEREIDAGCVLKVSERGTRIRMLPLS